MSNKQYQVGVLSDSQIDALFEAQHEKYGQVCDSEDFRMFARAVVAAAEAIQGASPCQSAADATNSSSNISSNWHDRTTTSGGEALAPMLEFVRHCAGAGGHDVDGTRLAHMARSALKSLAPTCLTAAASDVLAERQRQVDVKDWTPDHDDAHPGGEIAAFAAVYAMPPASRDWPAAETGYGPTLGTALCPEDWQPKFGDRRRELVKAGALILAEIERLDRAAAKAGS